MEKQPTAKRVGIWIRVSTDMQVKDESPEHHEQRARYYTEAKGWHVAEVYQLGAFSGKSIKDHPETKRMLVDVKSGHITGLVFSKLARLARNTKELLEFSEIFREVGADLVSLAESIDTSTPAGRLFFTIIAAMAQWEREEIASRVQASVPIRAKMGKPLGGAASYGYRWENKTLVIDEAEAPIRRKLYELFIVHQRKKATAKALNDLGYRTRNGSPFSDTTVHRLLRDSAAKGERIANYTRSTDNKKQWQFKPQSEWVTIPCDPIVSAELWTQCNAILDAQEAKRKKPGRKAAHLLAGLVQCHCSKAMYVFHKTNIYTCRTCKNRISVADIDEIYQFHLKDYLESINSDDYRAQHDAQLADAKKLLEATQKERDKLAKQIDAWIDMRTNNELSKESFAEKYKPAEIRLRQLDEHLPELEAEIDVRTVHMLSGDRIIREAQALYGQWESMAFTERRAIVETITNGITVGKDEIDISFSYTAPNFLNAGTKQHKHRGS
ncbi:recombinase family protein [Mucilaginibacter boryungensis]|uniref:Recombinase family protein n=1 Tax=Mucilaginibacter boryungensis TaxID=768480 RepID=A0ABR9XLQ2_9SPHI|nr:recombinase family protein [Mucilaginibacter boryungensis]MBE9668206.1 recombinase family protein [Mucilaginibacter boryungensis]